MIFENFEVNASELQTNLGEHDILNMFYNNSLFCLYGSLTFSRWVTFFSVIGDI